MISFLKKTIIDIYFADIYILIKEFDPGSEWTLSICLTHASWTRLTTSGERVSNTKEFTP